MGLSELLWNEGKFLYMLGTFPLFYLWAFRRLERIEDKIKFAILIVVGAIIVIGGMFNDVNMFSAIRVGGS